MMLSEGVVCAAAVYAAIKTSKIAKPYLYFIAMPPYDTA
jgi:hypothetical protein